MSPFSPPKKLAFVSCVSSTLVQPARSGSHLYPAHRNTVRWEICGAGLTRLSWDLPFGFCPLPLCLYYSTGLEVCQGVFYIFFRFRSPELPQLGSGFHLPLTPLLYHTLRGLSRGKSKFFQLFFALILSVLLLLSGVTFTPQFAFPLDNDSIPYPPSKCK